MKIIVGIGVCICGLIVWVAPLVAALTRGHPTAVSLGVIIGGVIIMSGIALVCLPNYPIKVPYFDKRPGAVRPKRSTGKHGDIMDPAISKPHEALAHWQATKSH
jgi:hypothetical protein